MIDTDTQINPPIPSQPEQSLTPTPIPSTSRTHVQGSRLYFMTCSILISLLLVNIEVSIVGTSLQSISHDLQGFDSLGWVVSGYLVTYTSLLIIVAKLSDILGRRATYLLSQVVFGGFSAGCAAARTIEELIVCRAFQGIGAAGCSALSILIMYEMVPARQYPLYGALVSCVNAVGSLTGPLIGGALSQKASWRWVFGVSAPPMILAAVIFYLSAPAGFPQQERVHDSRFSLRERLSVSSLLRLDVVGSILLLGGSLLLVTVLLEGGTHFTWANATPIVLLILSVLLIFLFLAFERHISSRQGRQEPIFPWHFLGNRAWMGILLVTLLGGLPYNLLMIELPQRFQIMHDLTPFEAGLRLIPFNAMVSFGGIMMSLVVAKTRIAPIYLLFISSLVQLAGTVPLAYMRIQHDVPRTLYAFEVLVGIGIGMVFNLTVLLPPHVVQHSDLATATGALVQFRIFGGCLGVAIGTSILNNHVRAKLRSVLSLTELDNLLSAPNSKLNETMKEQHVEGNIFQALGEAYNIQFKVLIVFSVLQLLAVALIWRTPQVALHKEGNKSPRIEKTPDSN